MVQFRGGFLDGSSSPTESERGDSPARHSAPRTHSNQPYQFGARTPTHSQISSADRTRSAAPSRPSGGSRPSQSSQTPRSSTYHGGSAQEQTMSYEVQPPDGQQGSYQPPDGPLPDPSRPTRGQAVPPPIHNYTGNHDVSYASGNSFAPVYRESDLRGRATQPHPAGNDGQYQGYGQAPATSYTWQNVQSPGHAVQRPTGYGGQPDGYGASLSSHGQYDEPQANGDNEYSSVVADDGYSEPGNSQRTRPHIPQQPSRDAPQQTGHTVRRETGLIRAQQALDHFQHQWSGGSSRGSSGGC